MKLKIYNYMRYLYIFIIGLILSTTQASTNYISLEQESIEQKKEVLEREVFTQIINNIIELENDDVNKKSVQASKVAELYEHNFFSDVALIENRSFFAYLKCHEFLASSKSNWPLDLQKKYSNYSTSFLKKIRDMKFDTVDKWDKYQIDKKLQESYYNFTINFILDNKLFWQEYLTKIINYSNVYSLDQGENVIFSVLYPPNFTFKNNKLIPNIFSVGVHYTRYVKLPQAHILRLNKSNHKIILLSYGCCGNEDIYTYSKDDQDQITLIKRVSVLNKKKLNLFNEHNFYFGASTSYEQNSENFFKWDSDNDILTIHYHQDYRSYKYIIENQKWQEITITNINQSRQKN